LAFHFSLSLTPNCRNWSPNYSVLVILVLHLVTGTVLQSQALQTSKTMTQKMLFQSMYALMCPPIFFDWELIHRKSKGSVTIKDSWRKSQQFFGAHLTMHFFQHIVLCLPLMLLKGAIDERNEKLDVLFPPVDDEHYSTYVVNVLLAVGISLASILPLLQYSLARLYFTKGHTCLVENS
jgi:hypothetical protein